MKTRTAKILEVAFLLSLVLVYTIFAVRRADPSVFKHTYFGLDRLPIEGSASFYACSNPENGFKEGLPVIICIGNTFKKPDVVRQFTRETVPITDRREPSPLHSAPSGPQP